MHNIFSALANEPVDDMWHARQKHESEKEHESEIRKKTKLGACMHHDGRVDAQPFQSRCVGKSNF